MSYADLRAQFLSEGFVRSPLVLPEALLRDLDTLSDALVDSLTAEERVAFRSLGSLISVFRSHEFLPLLVHPALLQLFSDLGFGDLRFSAGYLLSKPADSPPTFWHQDWGFWDLSVSYQPPPRQVGALFYLRDVEPESGAPRFLPGSHRQQHPLHRVIADSELLALRRARAPDSPPYQPDDAQRAISLRRGEVVLFDPRVLHGAFANQTTQPRHGLALWYFTDYLELPEGVRRFLSDGDPIAEWPAEARAVLSPLLCDYSGGAARIELVKHPDLSRLGW